ncbi:MAG: PhoPQ-activated pathogenicity-related family protein [Candidatus Hydrogenedentota bacterium]
MKSGILRLAFGGLVLGWSACGMADLGEYVAEPDDSYGYVTHSTEERDGLTLHHVHLTSQTWQGIPWKHWLSVAKPDTVRREDTALLLVAGGVNRDTPPALSGAQEDVLLTAARETGSVVAMVNQIPNQPLFDGLREDALIALTFERFLTGEGADWPLLLPMTKSVVRAMDAMQTFAQDEWGQDIGSFVVTGASKRGWTAWLTAAVDDRVEALVPMVFDILNAQPQLEHQQRSYGGFSSMIRDYTQRSIQERLATERGQELLELVDPYSYRDALTMPKLILLGANDPYWTVDAASLYVKGLEGPTHLRYEPDAGHGLGPGVIPAALAFYEAILENRPLPQLEWDHRAEGEFAVRWEGAQERVRLWRAHAGDRDFRDADWFSVELPADNGEAVATVPEPTAGWTAYYVEVVFADPDGEPYGLTTTVQVTPDRYPYEEGEAAGG